MSAMKNFTKMLDSVKARYVVDQPSSSTPTVIVPIPGGGYDVNVSFSDSGKDFATATVRLDDELKAAQVSDSPTSNSDDYTTIVQMVKNAPVQNGQWKEGKSQDGKYVGLLYQDNDCDYGVAFVCLASTRQFLGIVGF